jgi:TorA maturation chaperone TorD
MIIALRQGAGAGAAQWLERHDEFLREHLACWVELFTAVVMGAESTQFYGPVGRLLGAWVQSEAR